MWEVRVWVQQAGSCIAGWLFCKKIKSVRTVRTRSVQKKRKKGVRGIHGSSDHGDGSHLGNRSCASRYLYSVSTGKSLKSIYMDTSVFDTSKQSTITKAGKKRCQAVPLIACRAAPLTFVLISPSVSFSRSFSTLAGSGFRLFALDVVWGPGRADEAVGCAAVGVAELEEGFVECGRARLRVGGGICSCADMAEGEGEGEQPGEQILLRGGTLHPQFGELPRWRQPQGKYHLLCKHQVT